LPNETIGIDNTNNAPGPKNKRGADYQERIKIEVQVILQTRQRTGVEALSSRGWGIITLFLLPSDTETNYPHLDSL